MILEQCNFLWPDFDSTMEDMKDHKYIIEQFDEPRIRMYGYISTDNSIYRWLIPDIFVWQSNCLKLLDKNNWRKQILEYINEGKIYGSDYYRLGFDKQDIK